MKKILFMSGFLLLVIYQNISAQTDYAIIVFFRENYFYGQAVSYPVKLNETNIVKIKNCSYYNYSVSPGTYKVSATTEKEAKIEVTLNSNDTCYIRCSILPGFWVGRPELVIVDKNYGISKISEPLMVNLSRLVYSENNSKWGLGLVLGGGVGFERFNAFVTTEGDDVTLSSGGGVLFGGILTYRFSKSIEATLDINYSFSSLSQELKNATGEYSRGVTKLTLWGVLPLKGNFLKLKYGAGLGNYFGGKLIIDGTKLDGKKYELKYKPSIGYHGGIELESVLDKYYFTAGLIINSVKYNVNSITLNGDPTSLLGYDRKIAKPNGGGLLFSMGMGINL